MALLSGSAASLRFTGYDLDPEELTQLLECAPTHAERKGQESVGKVTGRKRTAPRGVWRLRAEPRNPGDLDAQIAEILDRLTDNTDVWRGLTSRYRADVFCGLFLKESNEGIDVTNRTLRKLADRNLTLSFDIYDASDD